MMAPGHTEEMTATVAAVSSSSIQATLVPPAAILVEVSAVGLAALADLLASEQSRRVCQRISKASHAACWKSDLYVCGKKQDGRLQHLIRGTALFRLEVFHSGQDVRAKVWL